jgi:hypothetical protein
MDSIWKRSQSILDKYKMLLCWSEDDRDWFQYSYTQYAKSYRYDTATLIDTARTKTTPGFGSQLY